MKKKILSMLTVFLLTTVMTSTVSAGGAVRLSNVQFSLGSLIADGILTGLGGYREGVTVELTASGIPVVTCTSPGGNQAPGQNPSRVSATGEQFVVPQDINKKGKALVSVETQEEQITGTQGGCPNDHWTAQIDFVFWTNATITVTDNATSIVLLQQNYTCITTRNPDSVSCTLVQ